MKRQERRFCPLWNCNNNERICPKKRIDFIDILKGMTIVLVVAGHFFPQNILFPFWTILHRLIYSFHMPLFMMISGYLYKTSLTIDSITSYLRFLQKKIVRLVIPYFAISFVIIVIKIIAQNYLTLEHPVGMDIIKYMFINPLGGYATFLWFIYVLFTIFLIFPLANLVLKKAWIIFVVLLGMHFIELPSSFCLNLVGQYLLYFWCGMWTAQNTVVLIGVGQHQRVKYAVGAAVVFISTFFLSQLFTFWIAPAALLVMAFSGSFCFLLLSIMIENNGLGKIFRIVGLSATSIYLLHTSVMAPFKAMLQHFFMSNPVAFFLSAFFIISAGVVLPILIQKYIFDKSRFLSLMFFGVEPHPEKGPV
jgi:fucose 4-O-acetylase-like acetyltransferase